jgi:hypothetical protein
MNDISRKLLTFTVNHISKGSFINFSRPLSLSWEKGKMDGHTMVLVKEYDEH